MSDKHLISIIIPVYNAEKTIDRCLESICNNDLNIQVVCIDDGSEDNSWTLLEKWEKRDKRICLHHQNNKGAASARNIGLSLATGLYIMFCDADDAFDINTLSQIKHDIETDSPDYIVFHRKTILLSGKEQYWGGTGEDYRQLDCTWSDYFNYIIYSNGHGLVVHNKVYKKSVIDAYGIRFNDDLYFSEDLWFNLCFVMNASSIYEDFGAYYIQYQTLGSICISRHDDYYDLNQMCMRMFEKVYPAQFLKIEHFTFQNRFLSIDRAVQRFLDGIDGSSSRDRLRKIHNLLSRSEIIDCVSYVLQHGYNNDMKNKAKLFYKNKILRYAVKYKVVPECKNAIKRVLNYNG